MFAAAARTEAIPPAIRCRIRDGLGPLASARGELDRAACERLWRLLDDSEPWLAADPGLADIGHWLIRADHGDELRRFGCAWLASFPSLATVDRLAALALDSRTSHSIREQAIRALGERQRCARNDAALWSPMAIQRADDALVGLADQSTRAGTIAFAELPTALRHVQWEGASAIYARAPGMWGSALECFGSPALGRVLLVCLADIPPQHRVRALRLSAAVLGQEAVAMLRARASQASGDEKLEALSLVVALEGEAGLGAFEDAIRGMPHIDHLRNRARWHLQHPGVIPTITGLRIARSTAVIPVAERAAQCGAAADDLKILTQFAPYSEPYVYGLWAWMVRGAEDPTRAGELVAAHPASQSDILDLVLEDLARRGRVQQLASVARVEGEAALGALKLAIWGKPLAALELAESAGRDTPELVAARALACYRAGRPDLARTIASEHLPPAQIVDDSSQLSFPGPNEQWWIQNVSETRPTIAALAGGLTAVLALAKQAPFDGEADASDLGALAAMEHRLRGDDPGATARRVRAVSDGRITAAGGCWAPRWVAKPLVATRYKPYRIAVLPPKIAIDGPDTGYEREAALLLWAACMEACHLHPQISALDIDAAPLVSQDGHLVPQLPGAGFYAASRRDEQIWLEIGLGRRAGAVQLHARSGTAELQSFEGCGESLGERIRNALNAWLAARGLAAVSEAFGSLTEGDFVESVRAISPSLVECARKVSDSSDRRARFRSSAVHPVFRIAALHLLEFACGGDVSADLSATDPDHPYALFANWQSSSGEHDLALLRRAIARAPGWDRPYRAFATAGESNHRRGEALSRLELVAAAGMATVCRPDDIEVVDAASYLLVHAGRSEEAVRLLERTLQQQRESSRAHIALLRAQETSDHLGIRLAQATDCSRRYGCPTSEPWHDDQIEIDLRASSALMGIGRLDEAIALRAHRLRGREASWPGQARLLERWRHEPAFIAHSYAREAYLRGDVARVLEGFWRAEPSDSIDLAMFVDALTALGREDEAVLAWAQFGLGRGYRGPSAQFASVYAFAASARYRLALEQLWRMELAAPGAGDLTDIARCAIALTDMPLDVVEAAIAERLAVGATTLARRMARLVADYVPAAAHSNAVGRALGKRTQIDFDMSWLGGFASVERGGEAFARTQIDNLFNEFGAMRRNESAASDLDADRARGDRLVANWLVTAVRAAPTDEPGALAHAAAYTAAQALGRYFAATTYSPSPIAGALRTVASEALMLVYSVRGSLADRDARGVLAAVEPLLRRIDRWVGATWLSAVERCLGLDERSAGHLSGFVQDLPTVAARILGPEETALLSWSVARLRSERRDGWAAKVGAQASRLAMHTGCMGLEEWAESVEDQLAAGEIELEDAIDALHTACYLAEGVTPDPCVRAARVLLNAGRGQVAFDLLAAGFGAAPGRADAWRDLQLESLREPWQRAGLEVPLDVTGGAEWFTALLPRSAEQSERLGRWAVAYDPGNAHAHRHLGLALAAQCKTVEAMHHLVVGAADQAGDLLVSALQTAGFLDEAQMVGGYNAHWQTTRGGRVVEHDEVTPVTTIASIASGPDGDRPDVATPATRGETLAHQHGRDSAVSIDLRVLEVTAEPADPVYADLESGAYDAVAARVADPSWRVRNAALRAVRFRHRAENFVEVPARAVAAANQILADAVGIGDRFAPFARAVALNIRQQAHFPRDPVPPLGDRMSREAFDREFRRRSGEDVEVDTEHDSGFVDRVVISNSKIARTSDYVALLRDLAQLVPEEALAQFDLDAASYSEVAQAWTAAMAADPKLAAAVEAGLAKR